MRQLIINIVGLPASGKSTLAKKLSEELDFDHINGEPIRRLLNHEINYYHDKQVGRSGKINDSFARVVDKWRLDLVDELLSRGRSLIVEGGINSLSRQKYRNMLAGKYSEVKSIMIYAQVGPKEHKKRLQARGEDWVERIETYYSKTFEPPQSGEYDELLIYDQANFDDILTRLKQFLDAS